MIFSKIAKVTVLTTVLTFEAFAVQGRENGSKNYDWDPLMDAITHVESRGDSRAVSGKSCGAMQITPILVQQCNIILKERGVRCSYSYRATTIRRIMWRRPSVYGTVVRATR